MGLTDKIYNLLYIKSVNNNDLLCSTGNYGASLVAQMVKNLPAMQETWVDPWIGKIPWSREWLPTPVFLTGEFHRQRSLGGPVHRVTVRHD